MAFGAELNDSAKPCVDRFNPKPETNLQATPSKQSLARAERPSA